jgi:hypothetical protein
LEVDSNCSSILLKSFNYSPLLTLRRTKRVKNQLGHMRVTICTYIWKQRLRDNVTCMVRTISLDEKGHSIIYHIIIYACDPYWDVPRSHTLRHFRKWELVGNLILIGINVVVVSYFFLCFLMLFWSCSVIFYIRFLFFFTILFQCN